jgi:diguanylate cyclase (GGDEF)-like protein
VYIVVAEPVHLTFFGSQFLQTFGALCVLLFLTIVTMCCALINTRQQEIALRRAAMTDALTGLLNRRALQDIGHDAFRHGRRTGVPPFLIAFDIDHFQAISDRYGRGVGDTAVCHVATLSARVLHGHGTMFRTGGEEFAVLLAGSALIDVHEIAQRVRDAVAASPLLVHGHIVRMTVSGGVAWCDPENAEWEDILHCAREALWHAKEHGGNRVSVHGMETRFWKPAGVAP